FARAGNIGMAKGYLDELLAVPGLEPGLKVEVLSLEGRYYKDRYARAEDAAARLNLARLSAECYLRAHEVSGDFFPLINAATMSVLAEKRPAAVELARKAEALARRELARPEKKQDYWTLATLAEALFILGEFKEAAAQILEAVRLARHHAGDVGSMRRNFHLLKEKMGLGEEVWACFKVGSVVVFAGHRLDPPAPAGAPAASRFPADPALLPRVGAALAERLEGPAAP